jgi:hypothetical protein
MITVKNLMVIERVLLEINSKYRFELSFNTAYKLAEFLRVIGRITNYSFLLQDEFSRKTINNDERVEYHVKILNSEVNYDWTKAASFIGEIMEELKNEDVNKLVNELKFW